MTRNRTADRNTAMEELALAAPTYIRFRKHSRSQQQFMAYEIALPYKQKRPGNSFALVPNVRLVRAVCTNAAPGVAAATITRWEAGASVAAAFKDADGYLRACYYETMLNLRLPGSWDRLAAKQRADWALNLWYKLFGIPDPSPFVEPAASHLGHPQPTAAQSAMRGPAGIKPAAAKATSVPTPAGAKSAAAKPAAVKPAAAKSAAVVIPSGGESAAAVISTGATSAAVQAAAKRTSALAPAFLQPAGRKLGSSNAPASRGGGFKAAVRKRIAASRRPATNAAAAASAANAAVLLSGQNGQQLKQQQQQQQQRRQPAAASAAAAVPDQASPGGAAAGSAAAAAKLRGTGSVAGRNARMADGPGKRLGARCRQSNSSACLPDPNNNCSSGSMRKTARRGESHQQDLAAVLNNFGKMAQRAAAAEAAALRAEQAAAAVAQAMAVDVQDCAKQAAAAEAAALRAEQAQAAAAATAAAVQAMEVDVLDSAAAAKVCMRKAMAARCTAEAAAAAAGSSEAAAGGLAKAAADSARNARCNAWNVARC